MFWWKSKKEGLHITNWVKPTKRDWTIISGVHVDCSWKSIYSATAYCVAFSAAFLLCKMQLVHFVMSIWTMLVEMKRLIFTKCQQNWFVIILVLSLLTRQIFYPCFKGIFATKIGAAFLKCILVKSYTVMALYSLRVLVAQSWQTGQPKTQIAILPNFCPNCDRCTIQKSHTNAVADRLITQGDIYRIRLKI